MPATKTKSVRTETAANSAKILFLDVEMFPNLGYIWGRYEQDVLSFVRERSLASFAWNWLGENKINVLSLPMFRTYKRDRFDTRELAEALHEQVSKADIVVGHNIKKFDDKEANTAFVTNGLPPPPPHKLVDTLEVLKRRFRFNSNKLGDACELLGLGGKMETGGFKLWLECMAGDAAAWRTMEKYNARDVLRLKSLYFETLPWMTNHPNLAAFEGRECCPNCGSKKVVRRSGVSLMGQTRRARFSCNDCQRWCTGRFVKDAWRFA